MSKPTTKIPLDPSKIDSTKRTGDFYSITNELTEAEFVSIQTEWKEIELFTLMTNSDQFDKLNDDFQMFKDKIIENFDYAITAVEFALLLVEGIQNLLIVAINYIYEFIYNQLDAMLRLGVYSLTTVPDFQDSNGLSLPTTSIREQADNIYKKFYDFRDPNVPYNMEYSTTQAEQLSKGGLHLAESLKARYEDLTIGEENRYVDTEGAESSLTDFQFLKNLDKPYFKRDYQDFDQRLHALSRPFGVYDGIFIYFSYDLKQNLTQVRNLIDAFAKLSFFLDLPVWKKLTKTIEREKRKRIRVIARNEIKTGVQPLSVTKELQNVNVGIGEDASIQVDPLLFPYRIAANFRNLLIETEEDDITQYARITRCDLAEKEEVNSNHFYYNYPSKLYGDDPNSFALWERKHIYELEITLDVYPDLGSQTQDAPYNTVTDYFNDGQRVIFYDFANNKIGEGIIVENLPRSIEVTAKGNWHSVQFSDLLGLTDVIKTAQNFVASKRNAFIPNTLGVDELLANLKGIKEDVLNLIDILEAIINILNISIQFDGKIYAKYVRDENYDKVASYLTDVSDAPPTALQKFKPSSNATIARYIRELKNLQENSTVITEKMVDDVIDEIDEMYLTADDSSKINSSIFDISNWGITPEEANTYASQITGSTISFIQGGLIAGPLVVEQISKLAANTLITGFDALGSAAKDFMSDAISSQLDQSYPLINTKTEKDYLDLQKYAIYVIKIKEELVRVNKQLSTEFGFSQVFLTYLPKGGQQFYPVRFLAQRLELINQIDGTVPSDPDPITNIDVDEIDSRIIENDIPTSEIKLEKASEETSTTTPNKSEPQTQQISLTSLYKNLDNSTNDQDEPYVEVIDNTFRLKEFADLSSSDILYGVRGSQAFDLSAAIGESSSDNSDNNAGLKFRYELKLKLTLDKTKYSNVSDRPRISNLNVYCGMISDENASDLGDTTQSLGERYVILYATDRSPNDTDPNFSNYSLLGYYLYVVFNRSNSTEPFPNGADVKNYIINKFNISDSGLTSFNPQSISNVFSTAPNVKNEIILPNTNESDYVVFLISNTNTGSTNVINNPSAETIREYIELNSVLQSPRLENTVNGFWQYTPAYNTSITPTSGISENSIFYENKRHPAYQYNSTHIEIFKFNQSKSKRIIGDCYIPQDKINNNTLFYPYILIGYENINGTTHHLEGITFELDEIDESNNFSFHRVK